MIVGLLEAHLSSLRARAVAIAAVAVFGLLTLHEFAQNGRYSIHALGPRTVVLDTRSGTVYAMNGLNWIEMHPQTGVTETRYSHSANPNPVPDPSFDEWLKAQPKDGQAK